MTKINKNQKGIKNGDHAAVLKNRAKPYPNPDMVKKRILKKGMEGLVDFFNVLREKMEIEHNGEKFVMVLDLPNKSGQYKNWLQDQTRFNFEEKKITDAFVAFLKTIFSGAILNKNGQICFKGKFKYLNELQNKRDNYDENFEQWRQNWFNETKGIISWSFGKKEMHHCALVFLCIITMIYRDAEYTLHVIKKDEIIESISEYSNIFQHQPLSPRKRCVYYSFEHINMEIRSICVVKLLATVDPDDIVDNPENNLKISKTEDFFNLEFYGLPDLMIQLLLKYFIEFNNIKRIKFCENYHRPAIQCENLLFEKKENAKRFCSGSCRKKYFAQSSEDPEKTRCRKRQISSLKNMYNTVSINAGSRPKTPHHLNIDDCKDCLQNPEKIRARQCIKIRDKNKNIFDAYYKMKPHMKIDI